MPEASNNQLAIQTIGAIGQKYGMTRIFTESGASIPVTVVAIDANRITQVKTVAEDGYSALQVTTGETQQRNVTRPLAGHFANANTKAGRGIWELRLPGDVDLEPGSEIGVEQFSVDQLVDVTGISRGKGFSGVIKRWHFSAQDFSHGNSVSHRAPGSIGQCQTPGKVFKGKKMAGQMGNVRVTTQNLCIAAIDVKRRLLFIKGSVPGAPGGDVIVRPAVKAKAISN